MTVPAPVPDPTADELAQLRRLTTTDVAQLSDVEAARLLTEHRCDPFARTRYQPPAPGQLYANRVNHADVYGAAADWWEQLATAAALAGDTATVSSERVGDVSVTYATNARSRTGQLFAMAKRLRRQSCNRTTGRTVSVLPPDERAKLGTHAGDGLDVFSAGDGLPDTIDTTPAYDLVGRPAYGQADGVVNGPAL